MLLWHKNRPTCCPLLFPLHAMLRNRLDLMSSQDRQVLRCYDEFDAPWYPGLALDQPRSFKSEDHLMDGWWRNLKVALHVCFGWRFSHHARISINEGEVLPLFDRVSRYTCGVKVISHVFINSPSTPPQWRPSPPCDRRTGTDARSDPCLLPALT